MATETPAQTKRVLVVEDEPLIRILLEDMLGELGYTVAAEAARIEEALEATKNADFDVAILDANLDGEPASPVADALVARGTPFVLPRAMASCPSPIATDRPCGSRFRSTASRACCRARCRALVSNSSFRVWGHLGRGKGRRGLTYCASLLFRGAHTVPHVFRVQYPATRPVSGDFWLHFRPARILPSALNKTASVAL